MNLDVLILAAHPDDAELSMGGTIAKLVKNNKKVGIIDMTRGEMGTRGSIETRAEEAAEASKILGLTYRENLDMIDGNVKFTQENLKKVVSAIRKHRPQIVFGPYNNDRHPDHIGAHQLVKEAMFFRERQNLKQSPRMQYNKILDQNEFFIICRLMNLSHLLLLIFRIRLISR